MKIVDFEAKLAAEGLAPVTGPQVFWPEAGKREAVDAWTEWARGVLASYRFPSPRQRRIWGLYAEGVSVADIAEKTNGSRRAVFRALERVKRHAGSAPPIDNPWRKSGRRSPRVETPVRPTLLARFAKLAVQCADLGRLLELAQDDPELLKLLPKGDDMAKDGTTVPVTKALGAQRYMQIRLREPLDIPGDHKSRDVLLDVLGRPHAGGIDVTLDAKTREGEEYEAIVTVPWWLIKRAVRRSVREKSED